MTDAEMMERAGADFALVAGKFIWIHPSESWPLRVQTSPEMGRTQFVREGGTSILRTHYRFAIVETSSQDMGSCQMVGPVYYSDGRVEYPEWWPQIQGEDTEEGK